MKLLRDASFNNPERCLMKRYILFFIFTCQVLIYAEDEKMQNQDTNNVIKEQIRDNTASQNKKKWGIAPVGIPYYTPDTSFGAGVQIIYYYNTDPLDSLRKTDEISIYGTYTLLMQFAAGVTANLFLREKIKITGIIECSKYPGYFWGVGPDTKDEAKEKYTPVSFVTKESILYNVLKNLYIGPTVTFFYSKITEKENDGLLALDYIPGSRKARSVGAGLNINWDSTDSSFYPRRGLFIDIKENFFLKTLGSSYNYSKLEFDLRYFIQIHNDHVIGFQCLSQLSQGTVPLHNLSELGGYTIMRGYLRGRYRDKNYAALQTEYRYPLFWRMGGTLFGSIGTVASGLEKFNSKYIKKAAGAGLRLNIDKTQHINARLDAGINEKSVVNLYFLVKEAF